MSISPSAAIHEDPWKLLSPGPKRQLAQAATVQFGKRGYHATTTRDIAEQVGMSPAGVYVHYSSKAELLFAISRIGHVSVLDEVTASIDGLSKPEERVRAFVRAFVAWHAVNHMLARVIQYELRSLEKEHYESVAAIRRQTEALVGEQLRRFIPDRSLERTYTIAVLSLGIDTARWYNPGTSPPPEELGDVYADLVLQMLGQQTISRS